MQEHGNEGFSNHILELGDSDFSLVEGEPNIIGWKVKDEQNNTIGEVDELLIDSQYSKVRYLLLDMEGNDLNLEARNVLIPIGLAEFHESQEHVVLQNVTMVQLEALPVYIYGKLTREKEAAILNAFSDVNLHTGTDSESFQIDTADDFYNNKLYLNSKLKLAKNDAV